jgi:hypothetical protein
MHTFVRARLLLLVLICLCFSGCTYEQAEGEHFAAGFSWWFTLSLFIGAVVTAIVGWKIREKTEAAGWIMMLFSVVVGLFVAPSLALNGTVIDDNGFRMRGGLLGMTYHQATYTDTRSIKHTYFIHPSKRRDIIKFYLDCVMADGAKQSIELSSVGAEEAGRIFARIAAAKGIMVTDETEKAPHAF